MPGQYTTTVETLIECRSCGFPLAHEFADLGHSPLANRFVPASDREDPENRHKLCAKVCGNCFLVQLDTVISAAELFSDYDYAYYSSYSTTWLEHARRYAEQVNERFGLGPDSLVIEVASNDGYLLRNFVAKGVPVLGVEPAANVAEGAIKAGIQTDVEFFGESYAKQKLAAGFSADVMVANNVLAHVPNIHDFVEGFKTLLKPTGVATFEFQHLLNIVKLVQFDTIYHEHYSYLSLLSIEQIFARHGLRVFDVQELSTHGGSLRVFVSHETGSGLAEDASVAAVRAKELEAGLADLNTYSGFQTKIEIIKSDFRAFLAQAQREGKSIVGYGAAAKGTTFLNFCDVSASDLEYVADRSAAKQTLLLPGNHIPVVPPEQIFETKPDYILVLAWNLIDEIRAQLSGVGDWGAKLVVAVPKMELIAPQ